MCTRLCSKNFTNTSSWHSQYSCVRWCYWLVSYLQIPFAHLIQSLIFPLSRLKWFNNNPLYTKIQTFLCWHARKTLLSSTHQAWEVLCHKQNPLILVCLHTCYPFCLSLFKVLCIWRISPLSSNLISIVTSPVSPFLAFPRGTTGYFFPYVCRACGMFFCYNTERGRGREKKREFH